MRISQAIARASPAPAAAPGRAAMVGLRTETSAPVSRRCRSCRSAILSASDISCRFLSRWAPMPLTLPPEQNAVPAPVMRRAPTCGFSPQVLIMVRSAGVSSSESELRASGRFSVMMATRSRITHKSSLVPVSTVISVLMVSPGCLLVIPGAQRRSESSFLVAAKEAGLLRIARNDGAIKLLHPRPQFEFPGPGAARLLQHVPVTLRDRIGVKHRVRTVRRLPCEPRCGCRRR